MENLNMSMVRVDFKPNCKNVYAVGSNSSKKWQLYSFHTKVMEYDGQSHLLKVGGKWSDDTSKHQLDFLKWIDEKCGETFSQVAKDVSKFKTFSDFLKEVDYVDLAKGVYFHIEDGKEYMI